tara:strand:+ start:186 stop:881 length:696 start_codon:yes stop_codon:yes gene_type:complete
MNTDSITAKTPEALEGVTWFKVKSRREVNIEIERLKYEGISTLRLGIDCAKFNTKKGIKWYDWLVPTLAESFTLELCFDNFSHCPITSIPRKYSLPEIVEHFIVIHGQHFQLVELWRNPSIRANEEMDENIFSEDVVFTATWAQHHGKKVGLGGIQTVDFNWITKLITCQFLSNIEYLNIDKTTEDQWSTNTRFYERTLQGLFTAKGVKTQIKTSETPMLLLYSTNDEIVC